MSLHTTTASDAAANFRDDLVRIIRNALGLPESIAVPMADELAKGMKRELGGVNIPVGEIRAVRDAAVRRDFNGRNQSEVIKRHGISRRTFYRIIGNR
jgi:Mor family transcriptional regulator